MSILLNLHLILRILRLKGLEKDYILWSTRIGINDDKEFYEFVYIILFALVCIVKIIPL